MLHFISSHTLWIGNVCTTSCACWCCCSSSLFSFSSSHCDLPHCIFSNSDSNFVFIFAIWLYNCRKIKWKLFWFFLPLKIMPWTVFFFLDPHTHTRREKIMLFYSSSHVFLLKCSWLVRFHLYSVHVFYLTKNLSIAFHVNPAKCWKSTIMMLGTERAHLLGRSIC